MENKGCITCRKCKQVRSNFFCGRTRLSQKQLYNEHGFCSDYEPEEQIEKPLTNKEWLETLPMEEMADGIISHIAHEIGLARYYNDDDVKEFVEWLKKEHK